MKSIKSSNYIKVILIVIGYVTLPFILNYILGLDNPTNYPIIGNPSDWLGFWAVYLGTAIPLIVVWLTIRDNNKQNTQNRELQTNVLEYQIKIQWINQLTTILLKCKSILSRDIVNELYLPFTKCQEQILPSIYKDVTDQIDSITFEFKVLFPEETDEIEIKFYGVLKEQILRFKALLDDTMFILRFNSSFSAPNNIPNTRYFEELLNSYRQNSSQSKDDSGRIWEIAKLHDFKLLSNRPQILSDLKNGYRLHAFEIQCIAFLKHEHKKAKKLLSENVTEQNK